MNIFSIDAKKIKHKLILILEIFMLSRYYSLPMLTGTVANVYTSASKLLCIWLLIKYIFVFRRISIPFICILTYHFFRLLSTTLNVSGLAGLQRTFVGAYPILGLVALIDIQIKTNKSLFLECFDMFLKILCVPTAILSILFPSLFGESTYLIGGENQLVFTYILSAAISYCVSINSQSYKRYWLLLSISIIKVFSAGNLLGWFSFLLIFIIAKSKYNTKYFASECILLYVTGWISIVVLRLQEFFAWLIVDILHKNLTLTNRIFIWNIALSKIIEHPIIGYGVQDTVNLFHVFEKFKGRPDINHWFSAHNQIIQSLYEGGTLSMFSIFILIIFFIVFLDKRKEHNVYCVILGAMMGIMVSLIVEAPGWDSLFVLVSLGYNVIRVKELSDINFKALCFQKSKKRIWKNV